MWAGLVYSGPPYEVGAVTYSRMYKDYGITIHVYGIYGSMSTGGHTVCNTLTIWVGSYIVTKCCHMSTDCWFN